MPAWQIATIAAICCSVIPAAIVIACLKTKNSIIINFVKLVKNAFRRRSCNTRAEKTDGMQDGDSVRKEFLCALSSILDDSSPSKVRERLRQVISCTPESKESSV